MGKQRLPEQITAAPLRTVRPLMLNGLYANPMKELARLDQAGLVTKIAHGAYTAKPDTIPADTPWRPGLDDAAMAYATTQYGDRVPVLYGIGAARFHHAIPRAIGVTVIAVPQQHRTVTLTDGGIVVFTTTDVDKLEAALENTPLGPFLVTTIEQTLLDLLARPELGVMRDEALAAAATLATWADEDHVRDLAATRPDTVKTRVDKLLTDTWASRR